MASNRRAVDTDKDQIKSSEKHGDCWIFIVIDHSLDGKTVYAEDILKDRMNKMFWLVNSKNQNVKHLKQNDEALFYIGRSRNRGFAGVGCISSKPCPIADAERHFSRVSSSQFDWIINLKDITVWEKSKPMAKIAPKVRFVKNKDKWWIHLQGGIIRISKRNFETVLEA